MIGQSFCNALTNPSPATNALPAQESGTKPARALPYQPNAWVDHIEYDANSKVLVWLEMANQGSPAKAAAHFSAYANAYRTGGPWQYTVGPYSNGTDGSVKDYFNVGTNYGNGQYDLTVVGPNRFLRRFTGNANGTGATAEASTYYAPAPNTGKQAVWFYDEEHGDQHGDVHDHLERTTAPTGRGRTRSRPGRPSSDYFNAVAYANGWYDFTVTVSSDSAWTRRATGHIETGSASVTG